MTIIRRDLKPTITIPKRLSDTLRRVGGVNPYGEPLFRLCLAQDRYTTAAGEWNIWPEDATLEERGGIGIEQAIKMLSEQQAWWEAAQGKMLSWEIAKVMRHMSAEIDEYLKSQLRQAPLRIDSGVVETERYPYEGFILEKWKPAHLFGSEDEWYAYRFQGEAALGPYPHNGDYELIAGPVPYMPTSIQLEEAVRNNLKIVEERPSSPRKRVALLLENAEKKRQQRMKERRNKIDALQRENQQVFGSSSLEAGRIRNEVAESAGLKGHYGA